MNFKAQTGCQHGLVGLKNLGNTCYMTAALQCLSHTEPLRKYFLELMLFKKHLNTCNPDTSKHNVVTIHFARFLNEMWNKPHADSQSLWEKNVFDPKHLKKSIGQHNNLFNGYS